MTTICRKCKYYKEEYISIDWCVAKCKKFTTINPITGERSYKRYCEDINKGKCEHYEQRMSWWRKIFK